MVLLLPNAHKYNIQYIYIDYGALLKTIMNLGRYTSSVLNDISNANNFSFIFTDSHAHLLVIFPPSPLPVARSLSLHLKSHIFIVVTIPSARSTSIRWETLSLSEN